MNTFALGDSFIPNAKKDDVAAALEKACMPKDKVSIQFEVLVPSVEWKYFMDDGEMAKQTGERMPGVFKNARRVLDAGLKMNVTPMSGARKSRRACSRSGPPATRRATPPMCYRQVRARYSSSPTSPTFPTNVPYLFAANPGWHAFFDQDPAMAEAARRKTYDMVVAEKLQVRGFHFPFPGLGNVEKDGSGYRVVPAHWNPVI